MTHFTVPPANRANARKMRKQMTEAELKLWNELRAHRLMSLAFRRQLPIAGYIVDFACPTRKLIVEVDGSQHADAAATKADRIRSGKLEALGWTILRFWNDDVLRDIDNVCQHIVIVAGLGEPNVEDLAGLEKNSTHQLRREEQHR
jgi:very-short-patch-repair endonuclease